MFHIAPRALRKCSNENIQFRNRFSNVSHSLSKCVCVCCAVLCCVCVCFHKIIKWVIEAISTERNDVGVEVERRRVRKPREGTFDLAFLFALNLLFLHWDTFMNHSFSFVKCFKTISFANKGSAAMRNAMSMKEADGQADIVWSCAAHSPGLLSVEKCNKLRSSEITAGHCLENLRTTARI